MTLLTRAAKGSELTHNELDENLKHASEIVSIYSNTRTYEINDVTSLNGVIYLSLITSNIGNTPVLSPTQWLAISVSVKNNLTAIVNPVVTDDNTGNYGVSSIWINISSNTAFICVDGSTGAAVWIDITASGGGVQNNFAATVDPVVGDDNTGGYEVGSLWTNTTSDEAFICLDVSTGAAVWTSITAAGGGSSIQNNFTAIVSPVVTDDTSGGYEVGSRWVNLNIDQVFTCVDSSVGAAIWISNLPVDKTNYATLGTNSLDIQGNATGGNYYTSGNNSISLGTLLLNEANDSFLQGNNSYLTANAYNSRVLGNSSNTDSNDVVVLGNNSNVSNTSNNTLIVGHGNGISNNSNDLVVNGNNNNVAYYNYFGVISGSNHNIDRNNGNLVNSGYANTIGQYVQDGIAMGTNVTLGSNLNNPIAMGTGATVELDGAVINIAGLNVARKDRGEGLSEATRLFTTREEIIFSNIIDAKTTGDHIVYMPGGTWFIPSEVGWITDYGNNVTTDPYFSWGESGNYTYFQGATGLAGYDTSGANYNISIGNGANNGKTSLSGSVTTGATATTLNGRFWWKGTLVESDYA